MVIYRIIFMNLGCTQQIESKLSLHSLARDLRLFVGWRIEDISCNSTFMKFSIVLWVKDCQWAFHIVLFHLILFPTAVSLCARRHSNGGYFLNILPFTGAK